MICLHRFALFKLAIAAEDESVLPAALEMLRSQGRMKYLRWAGTLSGGVTPERWYYTRAVVLTPRGLALAELSSLGFLWRCWRVQGRGSTMECGASFHSRSLAVVQPLL